MKRLQRDTIVLALCDEMKTKGSWCGETHLQKAVYFLQELAGVPTGFEFVLYKHGMFSFDLREELAAMRADRLLQLKARRVPYSPSIVTTPSGQRTQKRFPKTLSKYRSHIRFIAEYLADKGVADLERLSTALYVTKLNGAEPTAEERAEQIHSLKQHVTVGEARRAVETVDQMINRFGR